MASYSVGESVIMDGRGEGVITAVIDRRNGCREYFVMITGTDYEACLTEGRLKFFLIIPRVEQTPASREMFRRQVTDDAIESVLNHNKNINTARKEDLYTMKLLDNLLKEKNEFRKINKIPPRELSPIICNFLISVQKKDGSDVELTTLRSYISTFNRDLKRTDYGYLLTTSPEFGKVCDVLKSRQNELKHENKYKQK